MRLPKLAAFLITTVAVAATPTPLQFSTHNINPGNGSQNKLIAADAAGNFFIVSSGPTGTNPPVHVTKTDSAGHVLASLSFGGSGFTNPAAAAVDGNGNLLIGGTTTSIDFPLVSPLQTAGLAFLTRLAPDLSKILYSTRLGTPLSDQLHSSSVNAIALDPAGNIYVAGNTGIGLPVTPGAFQIQAQANSSSQAYGFVAEISADGSRQLFSTYYTGNSTFNPPCLGSPFGFCSTPPQTLPTAIAVDRAGNVIIAGNTSDTVPVTSGSFAQQCNCVNSTYDGFVAKLAPGGTALLWGTYLPLSDSSAYNAPGYHLSVGIQAIALDASGNVVLAGYTPRTFPTTTGALQATFPAAPAVGDGTFASVLAGFVAVLDSTGSKLLHSTYFGGTLISGSVSNLPDSGVGGMAVDNTGRVWLTGGSSPAGLPIVKTLLQASGPLLGQNYVAALTSDLSAVEALYTVPDGAAGVAIASGSQGNIAAVGSGSALLTGQPGAGPSIMGVGPSVAFSVSDVTVPYELITIYGINLGPTGGLAAQVNSQGYIARSLGGVRILFDGSPAALLYAGPNQINAIVPANTGAGSAATAIQVMTPSGTVDGPTLSVQHLLPGVFTDRGGFPAPALNQDGTVNSSLNPAPFGSIVAVFVTGMGSSTGFDNSVNFGESSGESVSVLGPSASGGFRSLKVTYAGSAPQSPSGVSQINFVLPDEKYNGQNYMSFEIEVGTVIGGGFSIYVK